MRVLELEINGVVRSVEAEAASPLLSVLRQACGLKGPRFGCGAGSCGACNVLIDGRPAHACDTPVWAVEGKRITTVEGLGAPERPHALQQAFIDLQAMQCGYCVSGVMVSAAALLEANPDPSETEVRKALDGNLCRCGAHNRMVAAVLEAAALCREQGDTLNAGA